MSTHESETEKEQGQLLPTLYTQETIPEQASTPGTGFPPLALYQSVDGGKTWQSVVKQIPYSSITPVENFDRQ